MTVYELALFEIGYPFNILQQIDQPNNKFLNTKYLFIDEIPTSIKLHYHKNLLLVLLYFNKTTKNSL